MAAAADSKEVKVVLVTSDIAAHALAAVHRPGPPRLGLRETHAASPVLRLEGVDARVRVPVIHQNPQLIRCDHFLVPNINNFQMQLTLEMTRVRTKKRGQSR